jgi:hypothetical protein
LAAPITALAIAAAGDLLAAASSCAQLLGTDAIAVAAAGGSPGAVNLYRIASRPGFELAANSGLELHTGSSRLQQQEQPLQLCHQWSLRSSPVSIHCLQSSHLDLLTDGQLVPTQVGNTSMIEVAKRSCDMLCACLEHLFSGPAAGPHPTLIAHDVRCPCRC